MTFHHTDDIEPDGTIDANDMDQRLELCLNRVLMSFERHHSVLNIDFCLVMEGVLKAYKNTHKSIRLLLRQTDEDLDFAADAMSLVREQVEKVFVVAILLEDPVHYGNEYFKDDWKRLYKHDLLTESSETEQLDRFQGWKNHLETHLEKWRKLHRVTDDEKELVTHRFENPGQPAPTHLRGVQEPKFPTPGQVRERISDPDKRAHLDRWYREYEYLCAFAHIGGEKLLSGYVPHIRVSEAEKKELGEKRLIYPAIEYSWIAIACICAEIWRFLVDLNQPYAATEDVPEPLFELWDELLRSSLKARVYWEIRTKSIMPTLLGSP